MSNSELTKKMAKFCSDSCPICTRARKKEKGVFYNFVKLKLYRKTCPFCRSYEKVYAKPAYK